MNFSHLRPSRPPAVIKRDPICKGDEAVVSRIWTDRTRDPMVDGLVERKQPVITRDLENLRFVSIVGHESLLDDVSHRSTTHRAFSNTLAYYYFAFTSLNLAKRLFPENFPAVHAYRIFKEDGQLCFSIYSEFVRDDTDTVPRISEARRRWNEIESLDRAKIFRRVQDKAERALNPVLVSLAPKIKRKGITLCHPEANYHVQNGKTVFFEVAELDALKIVEAIENLPDGRQREEAKLYTVASALSLMSSSVRFYFHKPDLRKLHGVNRDTVKWFAKTPFLEIVRKFYERGYNVLLGVMGGHPNEMLAWKPYEIDGFLKESPVRPSSTTLSFDEWGQGEDRLL